MRTLLATTFLALAASCGGDSDPAALITAGDTALGSGDHAAALSQYNTALGLLDDTSPQWNRAKLGAIEAMAFEAPEQCLSELTELAQAGGATERDFAQVGGLLASAAQYKTAAELLQVGTETFPDSAPLATLQLKVGAAAEAAANTDPDAAAALSVLAGLGYVSTGGPPPPFRCCPQNPRGRQLGHGNTTN